MSTKSKFKVKVPKKEVFNDEKLKCPYCGDEDYDSWELESESDNHVCSNCGKEFSYDTIVTRSFISYTKEYDEI